MDDEFVKAVEENDFYNNINSITNTKANMDNDKDVDVLSSIEEVFKLVSFYNLDIEDVIITDGKIKLGKILSK